MSTFVKIAAAALALAPLTAAAAPVAGGTSVIRVLVPLAPVTVGPIAPATQTGQDIFLTITGGDFNTSTTTGFGGEGDLTHSGGVRITIPAGFGLPAANIDFTDIKVDFDLGLITADASGGGIVANDAVWLTFLGPVTPAQLTNLASPLLQLNISQFTANLLNAAGIPVTTNQRFGTFAAAPEIRDDVPAPAALALFGLGVVGVALRRR